VREYIYCCIILFYCVGFFFFVVDIQVKVSILLVKYLIAASLCSWDWQESFGIMVSVVVGFLYILNETILCF